MYTNNFRFNPDLVKDEMKCFSSRFLIVPDVSRTAREVIARGRGDIFQDCLLSAEEIDFNFMHFIESEQFKTAPAPE